MPSTVHDLPHERAEDAVTVLCDAFHDYPVMRYVVDPASSDYDAHLRTLVRFFVQNRVWRREPLLAVADGETVVAVAVMTPPGRREAPPRAEAHREAVWRELGPEARSRYESLGTVWQRFGPDVPHLHLNMIGVRRSHAGRGLGGGLLDAVHRMSASHPQSRGVSLTTEDPANVALYRHFGYDIVAHERIAAGLETWGFYRPDGTAPPVRRKVMTARPETNPRGPGAPMGITIRPARAGDAESMVTDVLNPIIRAGTYTVLEGPVSVSDQLAFIREFPEGGVFHVAVDDADGRSAGLQDVVPHATEPGTPAHAGEISTFVALGALRAGIGRALCRATFARAQALGFRMLRATIRADNPHAMSFYESQGFTPVAVIEEGALVNGIPVDQILAEKRLHEEVR
jgi:L-amino acid N-acyltransferase YncA